MAAAVSGEDQGGIFFTLVVASRFDWTWRPFYRISLKTFSKNYSKNFRFFLFVLFVCSLARSFENFSKFSSRRRDRFGPKIVQFRPILAIFRPFENSTTDAIMGHLPLFATLFPRYLKGKGEFLIFFKFQGFLKNNSSSHSNK